MKIINAKIAFFISSLLVLSSTSQARYLQADRLDILSRNNDPQLMVAEMMGTVMLPQNLMFNHMYGYANQNPVNEIDPYGLWGMPTYSPTGLGGAQGLTQGAEHSVDPPSECEKCRLRYRAICQPVSFGTGQLGKVATGFTQEVYKIGRSANALGFAAGYLAGAAFCQEALEEACKEECCEK